MQRIAFNEEELIVLRGLVAIELDHNNSDLKELLNRLLKKIERKIENGKIK